MDILDRKLLAHLDLRARDSASEIARALKVGNDIVRYRIERLTEREILSGTALLVNPAKLGSSIYKSYLRLAATKRQHAALIETLNEHIRACYLAEVYGTWDITFSVYASDPFEFAELSSKLLWPHRAIIREQQIFVLTEQSKYTRTFDTKIRRESAWLGGPRGNRSLDELEIAILRSLSQDARKALTDIARETGAAPSVVAYRLDRLESDGVVSRYVANINIQKLGLLCFKVCAAEMAWAPEEERDLLRYLAERPEVTVVIRQVGPWVLEFNVEVPGVPELHALMGEIRERFSALVKRLDYALVSKEYGFRFPVPVDRR